MKTTALSQTIYPFRMLGMGLGIIPMWMVLQEVESSGWQLIWSILCCLIWPHLALLKA